MGYWAKAPAPREQLVLISTTLDDCIPEDHLVRLYAEVLSGYDWSTWEARYHGRIGQPPIHPRVIAGLWLYGLKHAVRSSRKLEYMAGHNIDFRWLAEGHQPDHSTLSAFRTQFGKELKDLFRHVTRMALTAGLLTLEEVATDGTRVKASNSRYETWNAERIAKALELLTAEFEKQLQEAQQADLVETQGAGTVPDCHLPPELADLARRRQKLDEVQSQLQAMDEERRKDGIKSAAQIPKHDPDSRVLPNKEGGFAPNYTPLATTEGHGGYIVDADVIVGPSENHDLVPSLNRVEETLGEKPERALADGAFATGPNIAQLEARGIEFFSHLPVPPARDNPAVRPDPTQPVPESEWDRLPIDPQTKRLDKACFAYDAQCDVYYCPRGEVLEYEETKAKGRRHENTLWRVYRCDDCGDCPLRARCVSSQNTRGGRTVSRDVHTDRREQFAARMQTAEAQAVYDRRMKIAETTFGIIKQALGLRQFLLRGLEKVKTEWLWTCTAFNLMKLIRDLRRLRAQFDREIAISAVT